MRHTENPHADVFSAFTEHTSDHELTVIHDDGLYRHVRMAKPGTRIWSWDIVTWPGYLTIVGDIANGYTFTRDQDMFAFFYTPKNQRSTFTDGAPHLDLRYWAEKLVGPTGSHVKEYSRAVFAELVDDRLRELIEENTVDPRDAEEFGDTPDPDGMTEAKAEAVRQDAAWHGEDENSAHEWMRDHPEVMGEDSFENDVTDFTFQYVLAALAIEATVRRYTSAPAPEPQRSWQELRVRSRWSHRVMGRLGFRRPHALTPAHTS